MTEIGEEGDLGPAQGQGHWIGIGEDAAIQEASPGAGPDHQGGTEMTGIDT